MSVIEPIVEKVISNALMEARRKDVVIHTFALYYDHETPAVSVCIDTEENSKAQAIRTNAFARQRFMQAVAEGDLEHAARWHGNSDRSFALGSFHMVNVARVDLSRNFTPTKAFFLMLVKSLMAAEPAVVAQARLPSSLRLCCTGANDEVQFIWSAAS